MLSVEQVERETRIRAKFLVAIENGNITEIPSHVQARGFVYNYAQYLGLDPADVISNFDALYGAQPRTVSTAQPAQPVQSQPPPSPQAPPPPPPSPPPSRYSSQIFQTPMQPLPGVPEENNLVPDGEPALVARLISSDLFLISILALIAVLALSFGGRALRNLPTGDSEPQQSAFLESLNDGLSTGTITPTFAPTSTPTITPPSLAQDRVRVKFEVLQRNWMRVEQDGEIVFEGLSEPGTILQYEGLETVRIATGNGAAISVTYNGLELGLLGQQGFVAEQIYTIGGLETLTPTPTPTTTPTLIPTATGVATSTATPTATDVATSTPTDSPTS